MENLNKLKKNLSMKLGSDILEMAFLTRQIKRVLTEDALSAKKKSARYPEVYLHVAQRYFVIDVTKEGKTIYLNLQSKVDWYHIKKLLQKGLEISPQGAKLQIITEDLTCFIDFLTHPRILDRELVNVELPPLKDVRIRYKSRPCPQSLHNEMIEIILDARSNSSKELRNRRKEYYHEVAKERRKIYKARSTL